MSEIDDVHCFRTPTVIVSEGRSPDITVNAISPSWTEDNVPSLLCSEDAGWITGQVIFAEGGASLMNAEVPPEIQLG